MTGHSKRSIAGAAACLAILGGIAVAEQAPEVLRTVTGRAIKKESSTPASGAIVRLTPSGATCKTGPDGRFELAGLLSGANRVLEIDEPSSALVLLEIPLAGPAGEPRLDLGDIPLEPPARQLVKVIGPLDKPLDGAKVFLYRSGSPDLAPLVSRGVREAPRIATGLGNGEYVIDRAAPGKSRIEVQAPRCFRRMVEIVLPRQQDFLLHLNSGGSRISGRVIDLQDESIPWARVTVNGPGILESWMTAGPDGAFAFDGMRPGMYEVRAEAAGWVSEVQREVAGWTRDLWIRLSRPGSIEGNVILEADKSLIVGARICAEPQEGIGWIPREAVAPTDQEGRFRIEGLGPGRWALEAIHEAFVPARDAIEVTIEEGREVKDIAVPLKPGIEGAGRVIDARTGKGILGARVVLDLIGPRSRGCPKPAREATADGEGRFLVKGLREAEYTIRPRAPGYCQANDQTAQFGPGLDEPSNFPIERGLTVSGQVLDPDGNPLPGARVAVEPQQLLHWLIPEALSPSVEAGPDGSFRIIGLPRDIHLPLVARHPRFPDARCDLEESDEDLKGINIRFSKSVTIRGRVIDEYGQGIEGAHVVLFIETIKTTFPVLGQATTDAGGQYKISPLERSIFGGFQCIAYAEDFFEKSAFVEMAKGDTLVNFDVILERPRAIAGRVVGPDGKPVQGAGVEARRWNEFFGVTVRTDEEGRFMILGLRKEEFRLIANASAGHAERVACAPAENVVITLSP